MYTCTYIIKNEDMKLSLAASEFLEEKQVSVPEQILNMTSFEPLVENQSDSFSHELVSEVEDTEDQLSLTEPEMTTEEKKKMKL